MILALVALNGLLAGAEMAIVSVRQTRLVELVRAGHRSARAVQTLRDDPETFLATVQVGITVVGAAAGAFGGAAFRADLEPLVRMVPWLADYAPEIAFAGSSSSLRTSRSCSANSSRSRSLSDPRNATR